MKQVNMRLYQHIFKARAIVTILGFTVTMLFHCSQTATINDGTAAVNPITANGNSSATITTYSIGGTITGLAADETITIQNDENTVDSKSITGTDASINYTMSREYQASETYSISVTAAPSGKMCLVSNASGTIASANISNININCATPYSVTGTIDNISGDTSGSTVHVWFYDSTTEILNPLYKHIENVTPGALSSHAFSLNLPAGSYTVRAFRDSTGFAGSPDQLPTLGFDPQSAASSMTVTTGGGTLALNLQDTSAVPHFKNFNAYAMHKSFEKEPPYYFTGSNYAAGSGFCRGFHVKLETELNGTQTFSSGSKLVPTDINSGDGPYLILGNGQQVTMLNDAGCSELVHDNTASSYDEFYGTSRNETNDNTYSYGVADPSVDTDTGSYIMFYRNTTDDYIHIEKDELTALTKLPKYVPVTVSGFSAGARVRSTSVTLTWPAVTGAGAYSVNVNSKRSYQVGTTAPSFGSDTTSTSMPASGLSDDTHYDIYMRIYDADTTSGGNYDIDAISETESNGFHIDIDGAQTITISGTITNNSSLTGDFYVKPQPLPNSNDELLFYAGNLTTGGSAAYSFELLKYDAEPFTDSVVIDGMHTSGEPYNDWNNNAIYDTTPSDGKIRFVMVYQQDTQKNQNEREQNPVSFNASSSGNDITFNDPPKPIYITSPANNATGTGFTPTLTWSAVSEPPAGDYTYMIYASMAGGSGGMPEMIWAVGTGTSFSWDTAAATDVKPILGMPASPTDLSLYSSWSWGLIIFECAQTDSACILSKFGGGDPDFYAASGDYTLSPF